MSKVNAGDKIKLKKEMGLLIDIGTICAIKEIDSHGTIIFSSESLPDTLGYMTEDELDKYFEIVKLEELNNNDLYDTIEDLKTRLKECEEIVAKREKEQNKVRLGELKTGDIFTIENSTSEYQVIDHLQNYTIIIDTYISRYKGVISLAHILGSDTLVEKVDDQEEVK